MPAKIAPKMLSQMGTVYVPIWTWMCAITRHKCARQTKPKTKLPTQSPFRGEFTPSLSQSAPAFVY
jgi:hypothetical protein